VLTVGFKIYLDPTLNTSPANVLHTLKISIFGFNGCKPHFNGFLRLKSWDFAFMLGLADMSGTWGPHVNWPMLKGQCCQETLEARFVFQVETLK
jgi:hypothetical protein